MNDVVQRVRTVFSADSRGLRSELGRVSDQLSRLQRLAVGIAGGYGLTRLVRGLIDVNAGAQASALGIASMIKAADQMRGRITPFSAALTIAKGTLEDLRKVAIDTPATFDQVFESYKALVVPARAAGMDDKALARLAGDVATRDAAEGGTGLLARDIQQMLRGRNDADSVFLRPYANEIMKALRVGGSGEALKVIQRVVKTSEEEQKAFGEGWDGRLSTFQDQIQAIQRAAGEPLFEVANEELAKMSAWLSQNKDEVKRVARAVGDGLVSAFKAVRDAVAWLAESGVGAVLLKVFAASAAVRVLGAAFGGILPILSMIQAHPVFAAIAALIAGAQWLYSLNPAATASDKDKAQIEGAKKGTFGQVGAAIASNIQGRGVLGLADAINDSVLVAKDPKAELRGALMRESERFNEAQKVRIRTEKNAQEMARFGRNTALTQAILASTEAGLAKVATVNAPIDARGSKITVNTKLETDDPARFANASVTGAFIGLVSKPLSATFGLGAPPLANGAR